MIEVNLLNNTAEIRGYKERISSSKVIGIIIITIISITALATFTLKKKLSNDELSSIKDTLVNGVQKVNVMKTVSDNRIKKEVKDQKKVNEKLNSPANYSSLSQIEKINYDKKFARKVFAILKSSTPKGVEFSTISLNNSKEIMATGNVDTRENISYMLGSLRRANWNLKSKPDTKIVKLRNFYSFQFMADYTLSYRELSSDIITQKDIPSINYLAQEKSRILELIKINKLQITSSLNNISSKVDGAIKEYSYSVEGFCDYINLNEFINTMSQLNHTARITSVNLKANGSVAEYSMIIVITVQD